MTHRTFSKVIVAATLVTALGISATASAQYPPPPSGPPAERATDELRYHWTVMWAPLRAVLGLAEFTGEYRFLDSFGAMVMAGGGRRKVTFGGGGGLAVRGTELEGGAQFRYYALRRGAHELNLAAEFMYERVKFDEPLPFGVIAVAAGGGTLGPLVGYKLVTRVGFTFEVQLGARYLLMKPPITGEATNADVSAEWAVALHINAGWSF